MKKVLLRNYSLKNGFTLTEILIAVVVVGVIAGLVLPKVIENYQIKTMDSNFKREVQTIEDSINGLAVSENKADFFSTMMYVDAMPKDSSNSIYDDTAGLYMKKYLRTSKMCDNPEDCFANTYYQYNAGKSRSEYKPDYKGACAILKNGVSICMTPQIGAANIEGIIDLNGKKGPNVLNRDLRTFAIAAKTRVGLNQDTEGVRKLSWDNIEPGEEPEIEEPETPDEPSTNPCDVDKNSLDCCKTRSITDSSDPCCTYDEMKTDARCADYVIITYNCNTSTTTSSGGNLFVTCNAYSDRNNMGISLRFTYPTSCTLVQDNGGIKKVNCYGITSKDIINSTFSFTVHYTPGIGMGNFGVGRFGNTEITLRDGGSIKYTAGCTNGLNMFCNGRIKYNTKTKKVE